jgi:hypothetical protein
MRLRVWLIAVVTLGILGAGGHAWAFWTAPAHGGGTGTGASLQAATQVTASSPTSTDTVQITWGAALVSTGQLAEGYYVTRIHNGDGATAAACGTSALAPTTTLSCVDGAVPDGAYQYVVTAVYYSWTAGSVPSNTVTVSRDTSPPTVTVTSISPSPNTNGVNNSSPVTVNLAASNPHGTAVASITYWVDAGTHTTVNAATAAVSVTGEGAHTVSYFATNTAAVSSPTQTQPITIDMTVPSVSINQASTQTDPTKAAPITFTVTFSEPVTGLTAAGVSLTGTAGATTATVTGSGTSYSVAVSGMVSDGTVTAAIGVGAAQDTAGHTNSASTSTDNTVTRDTTAPSAPSAPALTAASDTGLSSTDRITKITTPTLTGTAELGATVTLFDGATSIGTGIATAGTYSITSQSLTQGTHTITARATDTSGNQGPASAGTTITVDTARPTVDITQAAAQADPTNASPVNFTAIFSETVSGLSGTGVTLTGTANASTATVTGSGGTYNVAVSGMTKTGTVSAAVTATAAQDLAGNLSMMSTGGGPTRTVDYTDTTAPTVVISAFTTAGRTATITGTAGTSPGDAASVTIALCTTNIYPCTAPLTKATLSGTVNPATGTWTITSGDLGINPVLYARATQADLSGNTGTSSIAGPKSTL